MSVIQINRLFDHLYSYSSKICTHLMLFRNSNRFRKFHFFFFFFFIIIIIFFFFARMRRSMLTSYTILLFQSSFIQISCMANKIITFKVCKVSFMDCKCYFIRTKNLNSKNLNRTQSNNKYAYITKLITILNCIRNFTTLCCQNFVQNFRCTNKIKSI